MRIGIDLGGTKIECIGLGSGGREIFRKRASTPRGDYGGTLETIASLIHDCDHAALAASTNTPDGPQAADPAGVAASTIGIGHPGAISPATGLIKNANSTWLNGRPLREDLEALLGRPVRLANDANCFALSEATDGAAEGARVVFGVIIGTGVGGGIAIEGRALTGPNAVAGEWGHNPLPWPHAGESPGPACYCGRNGCIETFLSGPGLVRDLGDPELDALQIASLAEAGEPRATAALDRYLERMSRALASVINLLDPDVIVLGGGMSRLGRLYEEVPRRWGGWVFSDRVDTKLVPAKHGDSSGVRGAAWLWPDR